MHKDEIKACPVAMAALLVVAIEKHNGLVRDSPGIANFGVIVHLGWLERMGGERVQLQLRIETNEKHFVNE